MIRTPTQDEIAKLNAQVAEVEGKEQENAAFFGLYNRETGLVYRQYGKRRRPLRTREMIERFVRIRDQDGKIVPLMPNTPQRIAEAAILKQERANLPVRIIILKARKVGMSTWIVARGYARSLVDSHVKIGVLAHTDDTATEVLKMAHIMRDNVPKADGRSWKFAFNHQATYHIAFKGPMFGEMMIASAQHTGGSEPFRGYTPTFLHMSEASRYPNAEATAQSALVAVPKRPGTAVFIESTANGDHGDFKNRFWSAYEEKDLAPSEMRQSWVAIFVPWFWREDCRWTQTVGHGRRLPDDLIIEIQSTLTEHERWLLTQKWFCRGRPGMEWEEVPCLIDKPGTDDHQTPGFKWRLREAGWRNVDLDQLAWRRWTIKDEFNSDPLNPQTWALFQEEFPSTPTEAFRSTGALVFNAGEIYDQLQRVKPAAFRGELVDISKPTVAKIGPKSLDTIKRTLFRPKAMSGE